MTSHELARILLAEDDLPVMSHANNHTAEPDWPDDKTVGVTVAIVESKRRYAPRAICVGNIGSRHYPEHLRVRVLKWLLPDSSDHLPTRRAAQ
jgi:hypothetical protein